MMTSSACIRPDCGNLLCLIHELGLLVRLVRFIQLRKAGVEPPRLSAVGNGIPGSAASGHCVW